MAIGEDLEGGEVVLVVIAVGIGIYYISKALKGLGLSGGFTPTFDDATGAQLGLNCVVPAILKSGTITPAMSNAIVQNQIQTFPGICPSVVKENTERDIALTNAAAAQGPNAFQVSVNKLFGTNFGESGLTLSSTGSDLPCSCPTTNGAGGVCPSF